MMVEIIELILIMVLMMIVLLLMIVGRFFLKISDYENDYRNENRDVKT